MSEEDTSETEIAFVDDEAEEIEPTELREVIAWLRSTRSQQISAKEQVGLVDLDSTVADYESSINHHMLRLQSPGEDPYVGRFSTGDREPPYMETRRKLIQAKPGFWRKLKPLKLGFEVVALMRNVGFSLDVLTKGPAGTPSAWSEKLEWSQRFLPDAAVTVTSDKSKYYGRVLFDDFPPYFIPWLARRKRGLVVCLAQPWNADFAVGNSSARDNVFRYSGAPGEAKLLAEALIAAHDR